MQFRDATQTDGPRIAALHAASWRLTYRGWLRDEYLDGDLVDERNRLWTVRLAVPEPNQRIVLAEAGQQLAGFACAFGSADPELGTMLDNLHVGYQFQRQGIGARLMKEIVSWRLAEASGEGLFLWVIEGNSRARRFYENLRATKVAEDVWQSPDGGAIPSVCYAWTNLAALMQAMNVRSRKNNETYNQLSTARR
jgi:ribosomal protein S18 acetylase RimI-like enzyme